MRKTCKQCGIDFELSESEIAFYKQKNLSLPKRCKKCREENSQKMNYKENGDKNNKGIYVSSYSANRSAGRRSKPDIKWKYYVIIILFVLLVGGFEISQFIGDMKGDTVSVDSIITTKELQSEIKEDFSVNSDIVNFTTTPIAEEPTNQKNTQTEESSEILIDSNNTVAESQLNFQYTFRNETLLQQHYQKHGVEMGFSNAEEYLAAANRVVANSSALHKKEKEDGDDVYYLEASNEFVIVSTDGYIRTYFLPQNGMAYYDRQ